MKAGTTALTLLVLLTACGKALPEAPESPGAVAEVTIPTSAAGERAVAKQVPAERPGRATLVGMQVLAEHPGRAALVGMVVVLEESGAHLVTYEEYAQEEITVRLRLRPYDAVEPGTGSVPATPEEMADAPALDHKVDAGVDSEGVFVLVVEPGAWRIQGHGVEILTRGGKESVLARKAMLWTPPDAVEVAAGEILRLPPIAYVPPVRTEEPAADSRHSVSAPPTLRWNAYPGAASYEVAVFRIQRTEHTVTTRHLCRATVVHPVTELPWSTVEAAVPAYQRIDGASTSGEYEWSVRARDASGIKISSGRGPSFWLDE